MSKKNFISEYLSDESLDKISKTIGKIEKSTSGEIRICIKRKRGFLEKKYSPRDIALKEFFKLKIDKTKDRTGVLLFLIFDERKFEIIADEGINSKISPEQWNEITESIKDHFSKESYFEGIIFGIETIGEVLTKEFKVRSDDTDELSNEVIIQP